MNRLLCGPERRREFNGETGRAGLTARNIPLINDRSSTWGKSEAGLGGSDESLWATYSAKVW